MKNTGTQPPTCDCPAGLGWGRPSAGAGSTALRSRRRPGGNLGPGLDFVPNLLLPLAFLQHGSEAHVWRPHHGSSLPLGSLASHHPVSHLKGEVQGRLVLGVSVRDPARKLLRVTLSLADMGRESLKPEGPPVHGEVDMRQHKAAMQVTDCAKVGMQVT